MSFLYRNERTGWIGLRLDGALRHVPSMEVFFRLYQGDPKVLGMIRFESDRAPRGRPLCGRAALFSSGGQVFLVDEHPDGSGALVRRPLAPGAFAAYGFAAGVVRDERSDDPPALGAVVSHVARSLYAGITIGDLTDAVAEELKASGFTTLCLFGGHVCSSDELTRQGSITLGDKITLIGGAVGSTAVASSAELQRWNQQLLALKTGGSIGRILLTIGGGSPVVDFLGIHDIVFGRRLNGATFVNNPDPEMFGTAPGSMLRKRFEDLHSSVSAIDGIDLDDEEWVDWNDDSRTGGDTLIAFAKMLGEIGFQVTFCPYNKPEYWRHCLSELQRSYPGLVTGYHLQCYDGGANNDPRDWHSDVATIPGIDPSSFITPGFWAPHWDRMPDNSLQFRGEGPVEIHRKVEAWKTAGGFIWNHSRIKDPPTRDALTKHRVTPRSNVTHQRHPEDDAPLAG